MGFRNKAIAFGVAAAMAGTLFAGVPAATAAETPAPSETPASSGTASPAAGTADATGRTVDFDAGWKFVTGNPSGAQNADFDDSGWRNVDLPHDWRITEDFTGVGSSKAAAKAARGYLPYGTVWYRKTFSLTDAMKGRRIVINFDGVQSSSTLYVNGKAVGVKSTDGYTQLVGYGPFSEDITDYLDQDGPNVVAVKAVVNEPTSRWYEGGGIYRDVTLSVTDDVHVGLYGTDITTPIPTAKTYDDGDVTNDFSYDKDTVLAYIAGGKARLDIATDVDNDGGEDAEATVTTTILDGGTPVASVTADPVTVKAGTSATVKQAADIANPKLWSTDAPNLYTAKTIVAVGGRTVDETETTVGVRYLTFTANDGFYLNGRYMKIKGMCLHSDLGALGMAFNERAAARQLEILKAAGVNAIRTAHNPAARKFIELANRMGMMVLEEVGEEWTGPKMGGKGLGTAAQKTVTGDGEWAGRIWLEKELKTMVDRDKNDPAVIMWSIGNEITASQLGEVASTTGQYKDLDENLNAWVKEVDATRPTTMNNYREMGAAQTVLDNVDVAGYSYLGGRVMSEWHKAHPDWINLASESGSHLESRGKYYDLDDPIMGDIKSVRDDSALQLSAYDAYQNGKEVDLTWNQELTADYSLGEFNWTGFDYIGEPTPYAGDSGTNAKGETIASKSSYFGIVDTAGLPKDSYYLYKSLWTDRATDPMVHLVPSSWNWKKGQKIDVQAYSNAKSVELFLNGKSLGVRNFDEQTTRLGLIYRTAADRNTIDVDDSKDRNDFYLTWDDVAYEPGELKAVAYAGNDAKGGVIAEDTLKTAGKAAALKLTPDRRLIDNSGYSGDDLSFITVEATDLDGTPVPDADDTVTFDVRNGYIAGVDNGDGASLEKWQTATGDYTTSRRSLFSGKAMLIVRSDGSGRPIEVNAQSDGLADGTATVRTVKGDANTVVELLGERRATDVGIDPGAKLPTTVTAVYGDGHTAQLPVTWNAIKPADYAKTGIVTVEGMVDGTTIKATLTLSVGDVKPGEPSTLADVTAGLDGLKADGSGAYTLKDGDDARITVTATGKNGEKIGFGVDYTYACDDETVIDVKADGTSGTLTAIGKGTAVVTVTGSYRGKTATAAITVNVVDSGRDVTAVEPVRTTVMVGAAKVTLPDSVKVTYATGPEGTRAVRWDQAAVAGLDLTRVGVAKVTGAVDGTPLPAEAVVTVRDVAAVENIAVATPVGAVPTLPESAVVYYTDGTDAEQPVAWNPIDPASVAKLGFADATGTVSFEEDGVTVTREVRARIRVGEEKTGENRILYQTNAFPQVSSTPASPAESVGQVNDGIVSFKRSSGKNRWTTYKLDDGATPKDAKLDFILGLANETAYDFNRLRVYWYKSGIDGPADTIVIKYRNAAGDMVPVANQQATAVDYDAEGRGQVVDYTFDNVNTSRFELDMHKESGAIAITEIEAYERDVAAGTSTALTGLKVGGAALDGFSADKTDYTVKIEGTAMDGTVADGTVADGEYPAVEPEYDVADNPGVTVVPASTTYPTARVVVRSEDRESSATYTVVFVGDGQPDPEPEPTPDPDRPGNGDGGGSGDNGSVGDNGGSGDSGGAGSKTEASGKTDASGKTGGLSATGSAVALAVLATAVCGAAGAAGAALTAGRRRRGRRS